jgi:uncharacterized protein
MVLMTLLTDNDSIRRVLRENQTIAVLGAHLKESKAAYYVPSYLHGAGYELYPVNPVYAGKTLFGKTIARSLLELATPIDLVNVFRRSEAFPEHLPDILAMQPLPKVVWLQLGIRHDEAARQLLEAGIEVIQDRCMLADHQRLL